MLLILEYGEGMTSEASHSDTSFFDNQMRFTMTKKAFMWRLFAVAVLFVGCIESSDAARGRQLYSRQDPMDGRGWVVITTHENTNGKGKGAPTNSNDVGCDSFGFPTIAPMNDTVDSGQTAPPVFPTVVPAPTRLPTLELATSPPTKQPISQPTALPTIAEYKAACEAAANKDVYVTDMSISVEYLYELISPADRTVKEVASNVDEQVQDFLVEELVECDTELSTVAGVGSGKIDTELENVCSTLAAADDSQTCHLMAGSVVLYLLTGGLTLSDEEGFDRVEEKLKVAFNGARRSLQSSLVNEELGILGLHYLGGRVENDPSTNSEEDVTNTVGGSREITSSRVVLAVVIPVVFVACVASIVAVFFVFRRRKSRSSRGLLDEDESDISTLGDERWKEIEVYTEPLNVKVIETTDESESGSSGDAARAAHEVVMADLTGMTVSESLSDSSFTKPVFVNPDAVTLYSTSRGTRCYYPRHYVVEDTIDI